MPVMDGRAAARAIRALIAGLTAAAAAAGTAYIIQVYQSGQGFHPFQSDRELRNDQILFPDSDSASGFREDGDASDDSFWQEDGADDGTTPEGARSAYLFGQDQPAPEGVPSGSVSIPAAPGDAQMNGTLPSGGNVYEITEDPEPGSTDLVLPGNLNGGTASGEGAGGGEEVLPGGLHPGTGGHGAERPALVSDHGPGPGTGHPLDGLPAQASGLLWLGTTVLALMTGTHLAGSCALGFAGFLGLWMLDRHKAPLRRSARLWSITLEALLLSTFLLPAGEMESVTAFRADVAERIHALRFGKEQLPEGHLDRAALLNGDSGEVLHIHAGQEKTLYLRAYVGAVYEDGVWTLLPDSAYGGDSSGMLEWLGAQPSAAAK